MLPSIPAAIVTGVVWMPIFLLVMRYIERTVDSPLLLVLWMVPGFFLPVVLSTVDTRHLKRNWGRGGFFRPATSRKDFQGFYIPTWIRMGVWFLSSAISIGSLHLLGMM